ncbi:MAG: DNA/RNA non-specific endonuclease [Stomatobaculum sp.]|nr:DNA/RNA non-specific endonuclease [Stomatobaculum sp.]
MRRNRPGRIRYLLIALAVLLCLYGVPRLLAPEYESAGKLPGAAETGEPAAFSKSIAEDDPRSIPDYAGQDTLVLNGNVPNFTESDFRELSSEYYSEPDALGRCGMAYARLDRKMMPQGTRGSMGDIRPSGFRNVKYPDLIQDLYLYNRCHLIAWCLTGQEGSLKNLFTGTRHLNKELMLPYETQIASYLDGSVRHVLYRVTPLFRGNELVCRGVELEACSIEDRGRDLCFHVFLYNVQPGIAINYRTGESRRE